MNEAVVRAQYSAEANGATPIDPSIAAKQAISEALEISPASLNSSPPILGESTLDTEMTTNESAKKLIDGMCDMIERSHNAMIERMDGIIKTINEMKPIMEIKKLAAQSAAREYYNSIGHGFSKTEELKTILKNIQENHLQ